MDFLNRIIKAGRFVVFLTVASALPSFATPTPQPIPISNFESPKQAVEHIKKKNKRVISFLGYSGGGYQEPKTIETKIRQILRLYAKDKEKTIVNCGSTEGISMALTIAQEMGFETTMIMSNLGQDQAKAFTTSQGVGEVLLIRDDTWGGLKNHQVTPTSEALMDSSDQIYMFGGNDISRDEIQIAKAKGKRLVYFPAEMDQKKIQHLIKTYRIPVPPSPLGSSYKYWKESKAGPQVIQKAEFETLTQPETPGVLFLGNRFMEFEDVSKLYPAIDRIVSLKNREYGVGKWRAVFDGTPFDEKNPNIANIMKYLKEKSGIPIIAVQNESTLVKGGADSYVDYVHYVPSEPTKNKLSQSAQFYLNPGGIPRIREIVAFEGEEAIQTEAKYAFDQGTRLTYVRAEENLSSSSIINTNANPQAKDVVGLMDSITRGLSCVYQWSTQCLPSSYCGLCCLHPVRAHTK